MLGLGDWDTDTFDDNPHEMMIWGMFLMATFVTNICFLNMIIAIMGDTFGRV